MKGLTGLPAGFHSPVNGPYNWLYVVGFACVMFVSYNASWSLAQKYYSVPNERDASKAAYLSAGLSFIGAPLMILPAILGRHFLPDLASSGRSADTYVLLVIRLLPEGMVGIILAAMFSATMAAVSSDFNAIASVLTEDIYHRLIASNASQRRLLNVGRWLTLGLGALTTVLSLWIVFSHREALFGLMVDCLRSADGAHAAATADWPDRPLGHGARRIFSAASAASPRASSCCCSKTFWTPAATIFGGTYGFEGVSLITNTVMTLLGIVVGSLIWKREALEQQNVTRFFEKLARPVVDAEAPAKTASDSSPVLAFSTVGVALLIALAGAISHFAVGEIDGYWSGRSSVIYRGGPPPAYA